MFNKTILAFASLALFSSQAEMHYSFAADRAGRTGGSSNPFVSRFNPAQFNQDILGACFESSLNSLTPDLPAKLSKREKRREERAQRRRESKEGKKVDLSKACVKPLASLERPTRRCEEAFDKKTGVFNKDLLKPKKKAIDDNLTFLQCQSDQIGVIQKEIGCGNDKAMKANQELGLIADGLKKEFETATDTIVGMLDQEGEMLRQSEKLRFWLDELGKAEAELVKGKEVVSKADPRAPFNAGATLEEQRAWLAEKIDKVVKNRASEPAVRAIYKGGLINRCIFQELTDPSCRDTTIGKSRSGPSTFISCARNRFVQEKTKAMGSTSNSKNATGSREAEQQGRELDSVLLSLQASLPTETAIPNTAEEFGVFAQQKMGFTSGKSIFEKFKGALGRFKAGVVDMAQVLDVATQKCDLLAEGIIVAQTITGLSPLNNLKNDILREERELKTALSSYMNTMAAAANRGILAAFINDKGQFAADRNRMTSEMNQIVQNCRLPGLKPSDISATCIEPMNQKINDLLETQPFTRTIDGMPPTLSSTGAQLVPALPPVVFTCKGIRGCVQEARTNIDQITTNLERRQLERKNFVMNTNKALEARVTQISGMISSKINGGSQFGTGLMQHLTKLNGVLASLGVNGQIPITPPESDPMTVSEGTGLLQLPADVKKFLAARSGVPEMNAELLGQVNVAIAERRADIDSDLGKVEDVLSLHDELAKTCPVEKAAESVEALTRALALFDREKCYNSKACIPPNDKTAALIADVGIVLGDLSLAGSTEDALETGSDRCNGTGTEDLQMLCKRLEKAASQAHQAFGGDEASKAIAMCIDILKRSREKESAVASSKEANSSSGSSGQSVQSAPSVSKAPCDELQENIDRLNQLRIAKAELGNNKNQDRGDIEFLDEDIKDLEKYIADARLAWKDYSALSQNKSSYEYVSESAVKLNKLLLQNKDYSRPKNEIFFDNSGNVKIEILQGFFSNLSSQSNQAFIASLRLANPSDPILNAYEEFYSTFLMQGLGRSDAVARRRVEEKDTLEPFQKARIYLERYQTEFPGRIKVAFTGDIKKDYEVAIDSLNKILDATKSEKRKLERELKTKSLVADAKTASSGDKTDYKKDFLGKTEEELTKLETELTNDQTRLEKKCDEDKTILAKAEGKVESLELEIRGELGGTSCDAIVKDLEKKLGIAKKARQGLEGSAKAL